MPFFNKIYSLKTIKDGDLDTSIGIISVTASDKTLSVNCFVKKLPSLTVGEYVISVLNKSGKLLRQERRGRFFVSATLTVTCEDDFDEIGVVITATNSGVVATTDKRFMRLLIAEPFYDDEKIAEENYYLKEDFYEREKDSDKDACLKENTTCCQEKAPSQTCPSKDDDELDLPNENAYLLKDFGKVSHNRLAPNLTKIVPNSKFYLMSEKKEWYLGWVNIDGKTAYICYAVRANALKYNEISEYADFIPSSLFSSQEGYYLTYRDAVTGELLKKKNSS